MSRLKAIPPKKAEPSKPKILIYGKPGVGKTWASLDFPSVYYIDTEGGANLDHYTEKLEKAGGVYFGIEQGSLDFGTVVREIQALATEKHPYKTVVIDSITKIFNNEIVREAEKLGEKNAFGADKKPAVALMRSLINWIQRLDMNVVLIAHEKPLWGVAAGQRAEIGVTFDCWEKLEYELHLALNIIKNAGQRNAIIKKSRLTGFVDGGTFPWGYTEFAERYGKDVIEKEGTALVLATPEQLAEFQTLLGVVKLPEGQTEKWLTAAKASSFEEIDSSKMDSLITHIKEKYIPKNQ